MQYRERRFVCTLVCAYFWGTHTHTCAYHKAIYGHKIGTNSVTTDSVTLHKEGHSATPTPHHPPRTLALSLPPPSESSPARQLFRLIGDGGGGRRRRQQQWHRTEEAAAEDGGDDEPPTEGGDRGRRDGASTGPSRVATCPPPPPAGRPRTSDGVVTIPPAVPAHQRRVKKEGAGDGANRR